MMPAPPTDTLAHRRQGRRWRFASAVFDETSWTLAVDGQRVPIEAKPLEILHELVLRAGQVVTKSELLDAVWPAVSVVEASLPTAMMKLRRALGDDRRDEPIIETMPRIGYRLAVAVEGDETASSPLDPDKPPPTAVVDRRGDRGHGPRRWRLIAGGVALAAGAFATASVFSTPRVEPPRPIRYGEVIDTLRRMDTAHLRTLLDRGWNPNAPLATSRDGAIDVALEICEWNPGHDRQQLLLMVRMLMDGGARIQDRNLFGDTPYSIAKAPRYCGPDHPVTRMLHAQCYNGPGERLRDKCLATYELARLHRR